MKNFMNSGKKLELDYPCDWHFKIIGLNRQVLENAVSSIFVDSNYRLSLSHQSSGGKYISMTLIIIVHSDKERISIFKKLKNHGDIKIVL